MRSFSSSLITTLTSAIVIVLLISNVSALDLDVKEVFVHVNNESVIIKLTYEVDMLKKLQLLLFGAMPVKKELESQINPAEFLKVGIDEAVFKINFEIENGTKYFPGLEIGKEVKVYINVSGTTLSLENTTKIPAFYYS
jgi:hypothetical protein